MPRKLNLPGASELPPEFDPGLAPDDATGATEVGRDITAGSAGRRRGSGRVRHDDKITVYLSSEELLRLEQARLTLRGEHGLAVDRGRIVREAVASALDDLNDHGESGEFLRRLTE